jgi:hypothetical protein
MWCPAPYAVALLPLCHPTPPHPTPPRTKSRSVLHCASRSDAAPGGFWVRVRVLPLRRRTRYRQWTAPQPPGVLLLLLLRRSAFVLLLLLLIESASVLLLLPSPLPPPSPPPFDLPLFTSPLSSFLPSPPLPLSTRPR